MSDDQKPARRRAYPHPPLTRAKAGSLWATRMFLDAEEIRRDRVEKGNTVFYYFDREEDLQAFKDWLAAGRPIEPSLKKLHDRYDATPEGQALIAKLAQEKLR